MTRGGVSMVAVWYGAHQPLPCNRGGRCDWLQTVGRLEAAKEVEDQIRGMWSLRLVAGRVNREEG